MYILDGPWDAGKVFMRYHLELYWVQAVRNAKTTVLIAVLVLISSSFLVQGVKAQGQFVGSVNSDVYHYPSCTYAKRIHPENEIWFVDATDAQNHGYRPCKVCNPPVPEMTPFHFAVISMIVTGIAVILKKKRTVCERALRHRKLQGRMARNYDHIRRLSSARTKCYISKELDTQAGSTEYARRTIFHNEAAPYDGSQGSTVRYQKGLR
jgi:hypothetical protein